jgi:hypothetical protein
MFVLCGMLTFSSFVIAVFLNIPCSALACVPIFCAGKRIGGLHVAALAARLWAVFPNAIIQSERIWDTSLSALMASAILRATLASFLVFLLKWMAYRAHWPGNF